MHVRLRCKRRLLILLALGAALALGAQHASAAPPNRVGILKSTATGTRAELTHEVDQALLRDLAGIAGIEGVTTSPAAYEEIQLTVGCEDESRACLQSIAEALQADAVVVRKLSTASDGGTSLRLVYFEVSADHEPVVAESVTAANDDSSVTATVPHLVRTLFDLPEAEAPAARMAQPLAPSEGVPSRQPIEDHQRADAHDGPAVAPLTWVTLAAGAALLGTGVGFGISANNAFDDFKHRDVRTGDDVTRAHSEFDSAKARGTVANVLIPAGGAVLGVGAVLLFLDLSKGAPGGAALNVIPVHGGALATARRTFGGL